MTPADRPFAPASPDPAAKPLLRILAGLLVLLFLTKVAGVSYLVDDALISLHYAQSLADSPWPLWSEGLAPVEGFTSALHVHLLGLGARAGGDVILLNSLLLAASAAAVMVMTWSIAALEGTGLSGRVLALAVVCCSAGLAFWTAAGLETALWTAVLLNAYRAFFAAAGPGKGDRITALALLVVARPEGMAIAPALPLWLLVRGDDRRTAGLLLGWAAAFVIALTLWRLAIYGKPLPNTFYAKRSADMLDELRTGLAYVGAWITGFGGIAALACLLRARLEMRAERLLFVLGLMTIVAVEGGDPHPEMRFLAPLAPFIALDLGALFSRGGPRLRRSAIVLFLVWTAFQFPNPMAFRAPGAPPSLALSPLGPLEGARRLLEGLWPARAGEMQDLRPADAEAARALGRILPEGARLAASDVGAIAFFTQAQVIDGRGLNHPAFADLPKPEGQPNLWGANLMAEAAQEADYLYAGFPGFARTGWRAALEDPACGPLERLLQSRIGEDWRRIDPDYDCVGVFPPSGPEAGRLLLLARPGASFAPGARPGERLPACLGPLIRQCAPSSAQGPAQTR